MDSGKHCTWSERLEKPAYSNEIEECKPFTHLMLKSKLEENDDNSKVQPCALFRHVEPEGNARVESEKLELVEMEGGELEVNSQR